MKVSATFELTMEDEDFQKMIAEIDKKEVIILPAYHGIEVRV